MREALARSDNDFLVAEPRRKKAAPRKSSFAVLIGTGRLLRRVLGYPNRIAGALLVGLAAAIAVNALELQTARHPAPLFGHSQARLPQQQDLAAPVMPRPVPVPVAAPAPVQPLPPPAAAGAPATPAPDPLGQFIRRGEADTPRFKAPVPAKPVPRPDPISQILDESASPSPPKPSRVVLAAQRALVKLGFVLEADGIAGEATRRAIAQFAHDHHLPQRGELTPKIVRQLSRESGIAIP